MFRSLIESFAGTKDQRNAPSLPAAAGGRKLVPGETKHSLSKSELRGDSIIRFSR